jgi:hypothetical protein
MIKGKATMTFVRVGGGTTGVLYEPITPNEKSQIGILVMRSSGNYLTNPVCAYMSIRGYRALCANTSAGVGDGGDINMDRVLLNTKAAVTFLRKYPGVRKVLLFGHSEGGSLMTAYQDIAENGIKACQGPEKIVKCSDKLAGMPPADGVLLISASWGLSPKVLLDLDPSVLTMKTGKVRNPDLDQFNPKNGFNAKGPSNYSQEFIHTFLSAQGKRNNEVVKTALDRLAAINSGKGDFDDDEPFVVPGAIVSGENMKLFPQDLSLMSHTHKAWPLLRNDGSLVTEIVPSVRVTFWPDPRLAENLSPSYGEGAIKTTVRNFLSAYAIRVTADYGYDADSIHGVDWTSSYSSPPGMVEGITAPMLIMGMTGDTEYLASEVIFEHATKSADKTLVFVEGGLHHDYTPCTKCEKTPGQFGNSDKNTYDYVDNWISKKKRFLAAE